jgi:hypothetical protein
VIARPAAAQSTASAGAVRSRPSICWRLIRSTVQLDVSSLVECPALEVRNKLFLVAYSL